MFFIFGEKSIYNSRSATLSIYAGAGGKDAEDWAEMLLRMYERFCQKKGFQFIILDKKENQWGGINSVTVQINGTGVYGRLKNENGVHRLVRVSPFSAAKLRHTSFALVEVLPEIAMRELLIKDNDLTIETFRSSGPGGQNVQKVETAVRIHHLPTGIVVTSQAERTQNRNKERALAVLRAKLYQLAEKEKIKTLEDLKGKKIKIEWGNQIRSYILHPYQMVRDEKTGKKWSNVEEILAGNLDKILDL